MITNPYEITILHNMIIQTHKDNLYNISQQITDDMSFTSETVKNHPPKTLEEIPIDSLSDNPLMPKKKKRISKKSISLGKPFN